MAYVEQELSIKNLKLKNRLIVPPMFTNKAETDGLINEDVCTYYNEKSRGGYFSLFIVEHTFISEEGRANPTQLSIASDETIKGLSDIADIIHKNGTKAVVQINHAGAKGISVENNIAPSQIDWESETTAQNKFWKAEKSLDKAGISRIIKNFTDAAIRAKKAGFDGVEIHSAHGYLLNQFYSPLTNKRTDEYGGNILNRIKIHIEVIKAVRNAVGNDYPIFLRLGACDYKEGGNLVSDAITAAKEFEKAGIDVLDISGGLGGYLIPGKNEAGYYSDVTEAIKKEIEIPIILTGGITDIEEAESLLENKKADLIGIGRAVFKDSLWAEKEFKKIETSKK